MPSESPYKSTLRPEDFAPRPGFKIGIISIIVYLAGIAVHFSMYGGRDRVNYGGAIMGMVIGGYIAIFLLATLISFIGFAVVRSRAGATVIFCLSIPALVFADMKINALADAKILPPAPAPVVAASPAAAAPGASPAAAGSPAATAGNPTYSPTQRQQYIDQANTAFVLARDAKIKAFTDAFAALQAAGGVSTAGLTSKEAIAERRKLVETLRLANDEYINFITNQEALYRAELEKTPLVPNDVNNRVSQFVASNAHVPERLAVRETERTLLQANDDILAALDSMWGRWHLNGNRASFTKKKDSDQYGALLEKFNAAATAQAAAQKKLNEVQGPVPGATPEGGDAAAASPAASPATPASSAAATPAPATAAPAPSAAAPAASPQNP